MPGELLSQMKREARPEIERAVAYVSEGRRVCSVSGTTCAALARALTMPLSLLSPPAAAGLWHPPWPLGGDVRACGIVAIGSQF
jgi:hypothetical protein